MDSLYIKAQVGEYWRYTRQHPLLAFEANINGELADIISVSPHGHVYETEVKVSLSDLRKDAEKKKHARWRDPDCNYPELRYQAHKSEAKELQASFGFSRDIQSSIKKERDYWSEHPLVNYFYFAVPYNIANKAVPIIEDLFPYTGILVVREIPKAGAVPELVLSYRKPRLLSSATIGFLQCFFLCRHQSGTLVRLTKELCLAKAQAKG